MACMGHTKRMIQQSDEDSDFCKHLLNVYLADASQLLPPLYLRNMRNFILKYPLNRNHERIRVEIELRQCRTSLLILILSADAQPSDCPIGSPDAADETIIRPVLQSLSALIIGKVVIGILKIAVQCRAGSNCMGYPEIHSS